MLLDKDMQSEFIKCVQAGETKEVTKLVKEGADLNDTDPIPLVIAARENNIEMVAHLIKLGANPSLRKWDSPLSAAALEVKNIEIVKLLLASGANPNTYYIQASVLSHSCHKAKKINKIFEVFPIDDESFNIAKALLEAGASPDGKQHDCPVSPIEAPIVSNDFRTVKLLIQHGANLSTASVLTAANWCAFKGRTEMLEYLMKFGFKPNPRKKKDKCHASPLQYAVFQGHEDVVDLLIEHKINVNYMPNYVSKSALLQNMLFTSHPLVDAVRYKRFNIAEKLLKSGSNPNGSADVSESMISPIHLAIGDEFSDGESVKFINLLIEYGADVNLKSKGMSPFSYSLYKNRNKVAALIQENGGAQ